MHEAEQRGTYADMDRNEPPKDVLGRRALMRGAAWATPTSVASFAAPAFAASPPTASCPSTSRIDAVFSERQSEVGTYDGCPGTTSPTFTIWYDGAGGRNGFLNESFINVRNENPCTVDVTQYPLAFRIDIVNLSGPDTNTNGSTKLQRSLTSTNSYGYLAQINDPFPGTGGIKNQTMWTQNGTTNLAGRTRTVYSARWDVVRAGSVNSEEDIDIQFSWADGLTSAGRLTNAYRLVPLGMSAPRWDEITTQSADACVEAFAYYGAKVQEWYSQGLGCAPNVTWQVAVNPTGTTYRPGNYSLETITCGSGIWSSIAGDFSPSRDGIY